MPILYVFLAFYLAGALGVFVQLVPNHGSLMEILIVLVMAAFWPLTVFGMTMQKVVYLLRRS